MRWLQAPVHRKLPLQILLFPHGIHGPVHTEHLMVAGDDLSRRPGLALVKQDEVLDDVEQPIVREHAVQERLGFQAAGVRLVHPLPLGEVVPAARDRAVTCLVPIRDHQERVVMEGMGDDVLVHVVRQVVVEALADVPVDGLQFDEHQRKPVDEADEVAAAVVVGSAAACQFQFAHGEEAIRSRARCRNRLHAGASRLRATVFVPVLPRALPCEADGRTRGCAARPSG